MKGKKKDRTGETRIMNNGLKATIIEYFDSNNMTIRFENGEVREHVYYGDFFAGQVKSFSLPNQKLNLFHAGEKRIMNDGFEAELIAYRHSHDCDVLLADGTIKEHVRYHQFTDGGLRVDIAKIRVGEARTMNNGLMATIIAYHSSTNIDIRFENDVIRKGVRYKSFVKGEVALYGSTRKKVQKPRGESDPKTMKKAQQYVGERRQMKSGRWATIQAYRAYRDIDVIFDDGEVAVNVRYEQFKAGTVKTPKDENASVVGESRKAKNGLMMTIIAARTLNDIDVMFEDGFIKYHARYPSFLNGSVKYPQNKLHEGECRRMNNGLLATLETYRSARDVDVRFEDGCLIKHKSYGAFCDGYISHPLFKSQTNLSVQEFAIRYYLQKLGFAKIESGAWQEQGFGNYELDFFHSQKRIAIEYDGGIHKFCLEKDIQKNAICAGMGIVLYRIRHYDCPTLTDTNSHNLLLQRAQVVLGGLLDCKQELESILRENDIAFEPDFIDFYRDADTILSLYSKTCLNLHARERIGERHWANRAKQYMTIIAYRRADDIDVQFEDGTIRKHVTYACFQHGNVAKYPKVQTAA